MHQTQTTKRNGSGGSNGGGGSAMLRETIKRALEINKGEALRLKNALKELQ